MTMTMTMTDDGHGAVVDDSTDDASRQRQDDGTMRGGRGEQDVIIGGRL